jgi:hypothetical protein
MNKLIKEISEIQTLSEMSKVIDAINKRNRELRATANRMAKKLFEPGDYVMIRTPDGMQEAFLVKIRRTQATIRLTGNDQLYSVRLSQIDRKVA